MQFTAVRRGAGPEAAAWRWRRRNAGSDSPRVARPPTRRNWRRESPLQSEEFRPANRSSMALCLRGGGGGGGEGGGGPTPPLPGGRGLREGNEKTRVRGA